MVSYGMTWHGLEWYDVVCCGAWSGVVENVGSVRDMALVVLRRMAICV